MTSRRGRVAGWWLSAALLFVVAAGCGSRESAIALRSYQDPYFPETYHVDFDECTYRVDQRGDLHIVGQARVPAEQPEGNTVTQILHARVFWRPKPGVTFANSTTTTATLRYVLATHEGTAAYAGTGFVYPEKLEGGQLTAVIESGNLRLTERVGDPPDFIGDSQVTGTLNADLDSFRTLDGVRALELITSREQQP